MTTMGTISFKTFLTEHKHFLLVGFLFFPLYMTWTLDHSLWNPDETRDAGIAKEMFMRQDFIVPRLNGEAFLEKPPLYYWSASFVYTISGRVTAGLTRLPSALYGFLGILFTFLIGSKFFNGRVGFIAAAVLATSLQYFRMSHFATMDVSLTALLTGAFYFYLSRKNILFILFVILAFYAKGLVAVALPGLVIAVDLFIEKNPKKILFITLMGALFFFVCVSPWLYGLWKAGGPDYVKTFLIDNNWNRFFSSQSDHQEPIYFYLGSFLADFLPWTLIFIGAVVSAVKNRSKELSHPSHRFIWIWFLAILIFLSVSKGKRSIYLLPAFPAAALLCSVWFDDFSSRKLLGWTGKALLLLTGMVIFIVGAAVLVAHAYLDQTILIPLMGFIFLIIALVLSIVYYEKKEGWDVFLTLLLVFSLSSFAANRFFIKDLDDQKTFVPFTDTIQKHMAGAEILGNNLNEMEKGVFSFYLERHITDFVSQNDLGEYILNHPKKPILLITSKNKNTLLPSKLTKAMRVLARYRPDDKRRSYYLYGNFSGEQS
jgi:4-amino-4-deoxy-L-arabinose transferase-like glycosyltransferase